jgi:cyclic pyranopterin phosphate synthase
VSAPLADGFGRVHRALRLSVTDRCNLRCRYCMPAEGLPWCAPGELLTDDEAVRLVGLFARLGAGRVRVTGGEPLVRPGVAGLVGRISAVPGVCEVSMTTNGVLLAPLADDLARAGLARLNVSLDSLDPDRFARVTRRRDLDRVLAGIDAALAHPGLRPLKVNAVLLRGIGEADVLPLAEMARRRPVVMRFVEAMPLDADRAWRPADVVRGAEVRAMIDARWPLVPLGRERPSDTATRWRFADRPGGALEFVSSVSEPFCATCDRLRITPDGRLRTCLFSDEETDLAGPMRAGAADAELERIVRAAVLGKPAGHAIGAGRRVERPMSRIGG